MINKRFIPVILLTFVNTIGFSILIPVLPFVTEQYGEGPLVYGALLSAYSLFQFLAAPLIGSLSDKFGRRPTLILSQAGTFLSWIIFGAAYFVPNIAIGPVALPIIVIMFSRIVDGITGGNVSVTNAYVADITAPSERTKYYGILGAALGFGFIFGPAIGGFTASFSIGYLGTTIAAAIISLITLVITITNLTESLKHEDLSHDLKIKFWQEINVFKKIKKYSTNAHIKELFVKRLFFALAMGAFTSTFALYAKDSLNLDAKQLGFLLLFVGIFAIFNQAYLVNLIAKKLSNKTTFNIGQVILAISISLLFFHPTIGWFVAIMYITNLGISLSIPTFKAMLTSSVDHKQQGQITGVDESIMAGSNGFVPVIAGAIYAAISVNAFLIFAILPFIPFALKPLLIDKPS